MDDVERFVDDAGNIDAAAVRKRIDALSRRAHEDESSFRSPTDPPDVDRARSYLRSGAGQAIALYVYLRTGGRLYAFSRSEFERLERAMNTWFELYAACYGADIVSETSLRTAAEAFVDTEDITAVAQTVTGVPREG